MSNRINKFFPSILASVGSAPWMALLILVTLAIYGYLWYFWKVKYTFDPEPLYFLTGILVINTVIAKLTSKKIPYSSALLVGGSLMIVLTVFVLLLKFLGSV